MASNTGQTAPDDDWLGRGEEPILEPELAIVDPHHHLWLRGGYTYLLPELAVDLASGHNVIASNIAGDVKQIGEYNVAQGDFASLARVLEEVGVPAGELGALEKAIAQDKETGEEKGFGARTSQWLGKALTYVGKGGGQVVGGAAKATLTKAVMAYFGLE